MQRNAMAAAALTIATTGVAHAGGIELDGDTSQVLFEEGRNYIEFTAASVQPNVSGSLLGGALGSGNIQKNFLRFSGAYKFQPNDTWAFAIVANEPVGADVAYAAGTPYPFSGSNAEVESIAFTGYVKYNFTERVSAYGGIRMQGLTGDVAIRTAGLPLPPVYNLNVDQDFRFGYVVGGAYEIPDIALRIALTYESEIEHSFIDNTGTNFDVAIPQAVTLHAQTGVAQNTLVFGSVRWREWTAFEIRPLDFLGGAVAIASEPSDIWTFEAGVGQRFTENWSGALTIGYEEDQGDTVGNLSGRDGFTSYGVALKYEKDGWEVTTGVQYIQVGSAITSIGANFDDNDAVAAGVKVGYRF